MLIPECPCSLAIHKREANAETRSWIEESHSSSAAGTGGLFLMEAREGRRVGRVLMTKLNKGKGASSGEWEKEGPTDSNLKCYL